MEGGRSKTPLSLRPVRRARSDNRRTLVIKDGWTSYHVQERRYVLLPSLLHSAFLMLYFEDDEETVSPVSTHLVIQNTEEWFRQRLVHPCVKF
ncbi:hypothetical protein TNCV_4373461 [Trichonephila clavipes]|uniref:Uncharacterized protein n=1 Tax=Trichonephila clavipes TaxID=2585209 RepID=A0A8X6R3S4_TRICX|nr:hypothetical protein TNCV_4373461 [Trichonephila clavipes]